MLPEDLLYSEDHEWAKIEGNEAYIGLSHLLVKYLGDIVKLELPEAEEELQQTMELGFIAGRKNAKEIFAPLSGRIIEVNEEVVENPKIINDDPCGKGWLLRMVMYDPEERNSLLSLAEYEALWEKSGGSVRDEGEEVGD